MGAFTCPPSVLSAVPAYLPAACVLARLLSPSLSLLSLSLSLFGFSLCVCPCVSVRATNAPGRVSIIIMP
jgi:hypothetical protein